MDRYDKIFNIIEHPEKYSSEEISDILSNPEMKEMYKIMCKTSTVLNAENQISDEYINYEWERLKPYRAMRPEIKKVNKRRFRSSSRAASVAVIIFVSFVAIAVGISVSLSIDQNESKVLENETSSTIVSQKVYNVDTSVSIINEKTEESSPVIFEDAPLKDILKVVSDHYGVSVKFKNLSTGEIHLFYKFDVSKRLEDVVEQLNTFERITISIDGDTIIVE